MALVNQDLDEFAQVCERESQAFSAVSNSENPIYDIMACLSVEHGMCRVHFTSLFGGKYARTATISHTNL